MGNARPRWPAAYLDRGFCVEGCHAVKIRPQELVHNYGPTQHKGVAENLDFARSPVIRKGVTEGILATLRRGWGGACEGSICELGLRTNLHLVHLPSKTVNRGVDLVRYMIE